MRWETTITVLTQEGEPAADANVCAQYPDGRTAMAQTNDAGTAVLYLPSGDNLLTCSHQGARGSVNVPISGAPASAIIRLEDKRQIFICHRISQYETNYDDPTEYSELYSLLSEQYPDAVWITMNEWMSHTEANTTIENYTMEGLQEAYGLSAGDIILYPHAYKPDSHSMALNGESVETEGDFNSLNFRVGIALLPEETEDESASDIPELIWLYTLSVYLKETGYYSDSITHKTLYFKDALFRCNEFYWKGLEYGSDYRITEIGTEWAESHWEDPAPSYGANTMYDFYVNGSLYRPLLAEYAKRAFPYIELALADEWDELSEDLNENEAQLQEGQDVA